MKTELKILKLLITNQQPKTIREIAKGIRADYKITHTALKILSGKGIIKEDKVGKAILARLESKPSKELFQAEYERREELQRFGDIRILTEIVSKHLRTAYFILLVFGSFAKARQTPNSDIDIMLIVPKINEKDAERATSLLPKRIHAIILTETDFIKMKDSREPNVVHEAIKNNVILYGIEQFYELKK
jgi:predicted nucleotidyltransferase